MTTMSNSVSSGMTKSSLMGCPRCQPGVGNSELGRKRQALSAGEALVGKVPPIDVLLVVGQPAQQDAPSEVEAGKVDEPPGEIADDHSLRFQLLQGVFRIWIRFPVRLRAEGPRGAMGAVRTVRTVSCAAMTVGGRSGGQFGGGAHHPEKLAKARQVGPCFLERPVVQRCALTPCIRCRLLRGHPDAAVEADDLTVQVAVLSDVRDQLAVLLGLAQFLGEEH